MGSYIKIPGLPTELNNKANMLAGFIRNIGISREEVVGIFLSRSEKLIISLIAVLKAGGCYMPMDMIYPAERINYMISASKTKYIITERKMADINFAGKIIYIDDFCENINLDIGEDGENLANFNKASDAAYVIFTSGTTGKPKGVVVEHRNFINSMYAWREAYRMKDFAVKLLQLASFSFDVFSGDVARALLNGGELVICPDEDRINMKNLYNIIIQNSISILESVPALIVPLMDYIYLKGLDTGNLKILMIGSDVLLRSDFERIYARFKDKLRIINSYGVTEATIDSCFYEKVSDNESKNAIMSIGKPMANTRIYILGKEMEVLPIGAAGEMYISGKGVARGYINNQALNEERFLKSPFAENERLYKTGDYAGGILMGRQVLGRNDSRKDKRFRIEISRSMT